MDMAKRNKRNLREIWLDIVDDSRVEIAFAKPREDDEDTAAAAGAVKAGAGAVTPGDAEAGAGDADMQEGPGAGGQDAGGLAP